MKLTILSVLALPLVACGATATTSDAGDSAAAAAQSTASVTAYCNARADYTVRCGASTNPCEAERSKACIATYSAYRDEYLDGLVTCGLPTSCNDLPSSIESTRCVAGERDKVTPTATMQKLAGDLCAVCPLPGGGDCLKNFFFHGYAEGGSTSVSGTGSVFDAYSEALVAKIRDACLPTADSPSCRPTLYKCVEVQRNALMPSAVVQTCAATPTF